MFHFRWPRVYKWFKWHLEAVHAAGGLLTQTRGHRSHNNWPRVVGNKVRTAAVISVCCTVQTCMTPQEFRGPCTVQWYWGWLFRWLCNDTASTAVGYTAVMFDISFTTVLKNKRKVSCRRSFRLRTYYYQVSYIYIYMIVVVVVVVVVVIIIIIIIIIIIMISSSSNSTVWGFCSVLLFNRLSPAP